MTIDAGFVLVAAALLAGVLQAVKQAPPMKAHLWVVPFVAILGGVGLGMAAWSAGQVSDLLNAVLSGIAAGLSAVGLYETGHQATGR